MLGQVGLVSGECLRYLCSITNKRRKKENCCAPLPLPTLPNTEATGNESTAVRHPTCHVLKMCVCVFISIYIYIYSN